MAPSGPQSPKTAPVPRFRAVEPVRPWITTFMCLAMVGMFAMDLAGVVPPWAGSTAGADERLALIRMGAKSTALVGDTGESWRIYSAHLVHTGWIHLVFNLAFLFPVAGALESILRRDDYVLWLALVATVSGVFSLLWTPEVSAGASGLVFGSLATAVVIGIRHQHRLGRMMRPYVGLWLMPFLVVIVLAGAGNDAVDHANHLGGLLSGALIAPWLRLRSPEARHREKLVTLVPAVVAVALTLFGAPRLAHQGAPAHTYRLADAVEFEAPPRWRPHYGPRGEVVFQGVTSLASFSVDVIPADADTDWCAWYRTRHLLPLQRQRVISDPVVDPGDDCATRASTRYHYRRSGHATVRDLSRVDLPAGPVAVSFEVPAEWADKYAETRSALVGSIRPATLPPAAAPDRPHPATAAAIP